MNQLIFFMKQFLREPWWFKLLISAMFIFTIVFSSSYFTHPYFECASKLAAAIIFLSYAIKMKNSRKNFIILSILTAICVCLSIFSLGNFTSK